jgi:NADPH-dependent stearoyl-CoA 9-desaturase
MTAAVATRPSKPPAGKAKTRLPIHLNAAELEEFGKELDAIYGQVKASLGESDQRYIRRLIRTQRTLALASRIGIMASLLFLPTAWHVPFPSWPAFLGVIGLATLGLGIAKILENMEIGHNVMHGQWDWMRDAEIQSGTWEWDSVCPSDQWKHSHNVVHHTWTNVLGRDRDVGYEVLRVTDLQTWRPRNLVQPFYNVVIAVLFEWAVALHDIELEEIEKGNRRLSDFFPMLRRIGQKIARQGMKDYVLWPLLAGPYFGYVLVANVAANLIRNVWAYVIIFCGHFPKGAHVFTGDQVEGETRAAWYARQLLGSCNIRGGKLFHILSGNLSHQIEHHLFPDMPSNRYPEIAPRVQAVCERYGLPYNTGSLTRQFGTTTLKIWRLALP